MVTPSLSGIAIFKDSEDGKSEAGYAHAQALDHACQGIKLRQKFMYEPCHIELVYSGSALAWRKGRGI